MEVNMIFKNNLRPAFASASVGGQAYGRKAQKGAFVYDADASQNDDYGAYNTSGSSANASRGPKRSGIRPSVIGIAVAAVVAVILLIVLIVALAGGNGGHVKYSDNSFAAFSDEDGIYRVVANGKTIKEYESEVELVIADDRSFAYIITNSDDGYRIAVTYGKEAVEITPSPVTKILATATLSPAVVWLDADNGVYLYTDEKGEERITREIEHTEANADHSFCISADGKTVAYTKMNEDDPSIKYLCVYTDNAEIRFQKNMIPVALSDDGSMIYAKATRDGTSYSLYVLPFNDEADRYLISENFGSILATNTTGNEIVFSTLTSDGVTTNLVKFNLKKMDEVAEPLKIGSNKLGGLYYPVAVNPQIARYATFADTYFECRYSEIDEAIEYTAPVRYITKKFESKSVSSYAGKFDPDGDYFYYINSKSSLYRVDLSDDDYVSEKITDDVVDFAVTQKGNVYWLDEASRVMYYSVSKDKRTRIADNVEGISMYTYSNTLYFSFVDGVSVFSSKEGSEKEAVKFDSATVTGLPFFADAASKKTFVAFYDQDSEVYKMFYTANGKSFKAVATCADIYGINIPVTLSDIINDIVDSITGKDTTTDTSATTTDTSAQ